MERVGGGTSITLTEVNGKAAPLTVPLTSQQIYGSNGPYSVGGTFLPGLVNDLHGEVYNRLVSGFAFGYWGGRYGNHVDDIAGTGWWRKPAFAAARRGRAPFTARAPQYSPYAAVIARASANQVYGHPFADALPNNPGALVNVPANATMKLVILPNQSKGRQPAFCTRPRAAGAAASDHGAKQRKRLGGRLRVAELLESPRIRAADDAHEDRRTRGLGDVHPLIRDVAR